MNIVVPLAGIDVDFEKNSLPKPLTPVCGKPVIQHIGESRPYSLSAAIFILLREHQRKYMIDTRLRDVFGNKIKIVWAEQMTAGAPQSVLLAKEHINNEQPLLIDLADQYLDLPGFMDFIKTQKMGGVIPTFESYYYNRGYMTYDDVGKVKKVSEKDKIPISTHSTACISYFSKGSDFVSAAERMIKNNKVAANGAYMVSLAYNECIADGRVVVPFPCDFIATLGTIAGVAAFEQMVRPLKCSKEIFKLRVSECPIFLHRGHRNFSENSLEAIRGALEKGFSVELDVRRTQDGVFVLNHDDCVILGKESIKVSTSSVEEMEKLKQLTTLEQAFSELSKRAFGVFAVHVKDNASEDIIFQICTSILKHRLENRVFLFGDEDNALPVASLTKILFPALFVGFHIKARSFKPDDIPSFVDVAWVDEDEPGQIKKDFVLWTKKRGLLSIAISPELIQPRVDEGAASVRCSELLKYGFDGICTNFARILSQ